MFFLRIYCIINEYKELKMDNSGKENSGDGKNVELEKIVEATLQQKDCCDVAEMMHNSGITPDTIFEHEGNNITFNEFLSKNNPDVLKSYKGQEERKKPDTHKEAYNPQDGESVAQSRSNQREISQVKELRDAQEQTETKRELISNPQDASKLVEATNARNPFLGNHSSFVEMVKDQESSDFGRTPE